MINQTMMKLGNKRSVIRDIFEYGNQLRKEIGSENVFDFSIGNPNVPAPEDVNKTIHHLLDTYDDTFVHGYTSAQGTEAVRSAVAKDLNERFGTSFHAGNFYMTCGAAASIKISLTALYTEGDEVIIFSPFFPEYTVFAETAGYKLVIVPSDQETFQIDFAALEAAITPCTKCIIVNSPNNPTGVVYTEETIQKLADLMAKKSTEYGHPIYLMSDEPYRELVYDDIAVPYLTKYYLDTIVCYSYSKSLSLPGERIGFILVPDEMTNAKDVYAAVCGAGRALGYICAPSVMQHVITQVAGQVSDLSIYRKNRDLIYNALTEYGFTCIHPDGAFYLFMKSPEPDAIAFCEKAKQFHLLMVPADSFGAPGFVRISYCVSTDIIERSLPGFRQLAALYF